MDPILRHIEARTVLALDQQVQTMPGQIVSKTLVQNQAVSITLFAFDQGEEISTHDTTGDALISVLAGRGRITIDGEEFFLTAGQSIVMPAKHPHAVFAPEPFTMMLTVVFP